VRADVAVGSKSRSLVAQSDFDVGRNSGHCSTGLQGTPSNRSIDIRQKLLVVVDQADLRCPVLTEKISRFARRANLPQSAALISTPNQRHNLHYPAPTEGRFAIVTNVGRDAVDADGADDERRNRRTAKSCGPDAPTLASSLREATFAGDGGKKARSPGRARYKP
jgi:hypothetical protein